MILFDQENPPFHIPSRAREVYDLSGAGDTAIGLFTLALASGASAIEAAEISNHASSVVVGKLGTATLTPEELMESFQQRREMDRMNPGGQKAIFLDRDGTLMKDVGYCSRSRRCRTSGRRWQTASEAEGGWLQDCHRHKPKRYRTGVLH